MLQVKNNWLLLTSSPLMRREIQHLYDKATDWVLIAGPRIVFALIILFLGLWLIRILRKKLDRHLGRKNVHSSLRPFIESLTFTALHIALVFLIMPVLGIQ